MTQIIIIKNLVFKIYEKTLKNISYLSNWLFYSRIHQYNLYHPKINEVIFYFFYIYAFLYGNKLLFKH